MKQKLQKNQKPHTRDRPIHLHLEYFFRLKLFLLMAAGLLAFALARTDSNALAVVAEKAGDVGAHMSEERLHPHISVNILRVATIASGR
jgi:hypothetical protein